LTYDVSGIFRGEMLVVRIRPLVPWRQKRSTTPRILRRLLWFDCVIGWDSSVGIDPRVRQHGG
jgi:hypothetical protein